MLTEVKPEWRIFTLFSYVLLGNAQTYLRLLTDFEFATLLDSCHLGKFTTPESVKWDFLKICILAYYLTLKQCGNNIKTTSSGFIRERLCSIRRVNIFRTYI